MTVRNITFLSVAAFGLNIYTRTIGICNVVFNGFLCFFSENENLTQQEKRICLFSNRENTDLTHGQGALRTFKIISADRLKSLFGRAMFLELILSGQHTASIGLTRPLICR